jgi:threonine synthase
VVCVLTGHVLKDPGLVVDYHLGQLEGHATPRANAPISVDADARSVRDAIREARRRSGSV